ncbi:2-amino-4-hydroxy-6-hydroxymethyldihydropteridine diphosphokinase [Pedobacter sp. CG_S7]|uniref:2-amino-4-hydroxy-6- hydroxymethyldihydropteridine diphosphokinase n=1 Tax=Pedobacter sp. CG_S7 TaxID=3143930 RepID=UPI0033940C1F
MFPNFNAVKKWSTYMVLDTKVVYLLLGSNLGERDLLIEEAIVHINKRIGPINLRSSFYETKAWGKVDQPAFLNLALAVETSLTALEVLSSVLEIEKELGRVRLEKWGERLIDIDLIFYNDAIINLPGQLQIPHPEMHNRRFVMVPMAEIAGAVQHPVFKKSVTELLQSLSDNLAVLKI